MAKKNLAIVKITGIPQVKHDLLKFVQQQTKEDALLNMVGDTMVTQIRKRTQAGLENYKQPPLTETTIKVRELLGKDRFNKGEFFDPKRSNLTMTGQLLKALSFKIEAAAATVKLYLTENRRPIFPLSQFASEQLTSAIKDSDPDAKHKRAIIGIASRRPKEKTNQEIRKDLELRGRIFMIISPSLMAQLQSKIAQVLRKRLSLYKKISSK